MVAALLHNETPMENPELVLFRNTVKRMQPMLDELVFAGGCSTALLFSEADFIRPTPPQWLDVIASTQGELGHTGLTIKLKEMGMREDTIFGRGRWKMGALTVCFWNVDPVFSPFASRFMRDAFAMPRRYPVADMKAKLVNAAFFMAVKLEAFQGRGQGNYQTSDDLNDLVSLLSARAEVAYDLKLAAPQVRAFVQKTLAELKPKHEFQEAIKRILNNDATRIELALARLNEVVRIDLK
jgi:hypothetical protein